MRSFSLFLLLLYSTARAEYSFQAEGLVGYIKGVY